MKLNKKDKVPLLRAFFRIILLVVVYSCQSQNLMSKRTKVYAVVSMSVSKPNIIQNEKEIASKSDVMQQSKNDIMLFNNGKFIMVQDKEDPKLSIMKFESKLKQVLMIPEK